MHLAPLWIHDEGSRRREHPSRYPLSSDGSQVLYEDAPLRDWSDMIKSDMANWAPEVLVIGRSNSRSGSRVALTRARELFTTAVARTAPHLGQVIGV
jgi:hypothetical protein